MTPCRRSPAVGTGHPSARRRTWRRARAAGECISRPSATSATRSDAKSDARALASAQRAPARQPGGAGAALGCCLPLSAGARTRSPFLVFIHAVHLPQL